VSLPCPDGAFAAAIAINSIHNLAPAACVTALREMERVAPGRGFIQVDSYHTEADRALFLDWVLTAETHGYPETWFALFEEAGYKGDWYWTYV
jgi:ubiquinone/menaquinone biosynthesis C-methylase UbiE